MTGKKIRIANIKYNDIVDCDEGICVSLWMQGCSHHCKGCHNPETWDFNKGIEIDREELINKIIYALTNNGIKRNFSILGGEPLDPKNVNDTIFIINEIRNNFPNIKIFLWTGYTFEDLSKDIKVQLKKVDVIIDGEYREEERDITLPLRGSRNQRILYNNIDY